MLNVYEVLELEKKWQEYKEQKATNNNTFVKNINLNDKNFLKPIKQSKFFIKILILIICIVIVYFISSFVNFNFFSNKATQDDISSAAKISKQKFQEPDSQKLAYQQEQLKIDLEKEKIRAKIQQEAEEAKHEIDEDELNQPNSSSYKLTPNVLLLPKTLELKHNGSKQTRVIPAVKKPSPIQPSESVNISHIKQQVEVKQEADNGQDDKQLITFEQSKITIDDMIKTFNASPNLHNALKIAKEYYKNNNFSQAKAWALRANSLDKDNDESWIIFAKSSYKLGKKQDAIEALEHFLQFNNSNNAKNALRLIKQGGI